LLHNDQRSRFPGLSNPVTLPNMSASGQCPECIYSLHGLTTPRCPECGVDLFFADGAGTVTTISEDPGAKRVILRLTDRVDVEIQTSAECAATEPNALDAK